MKKKSFVVQAQFGRCIMSLETKESTTNAIVIRAKGTNLHFSPREFVVVTGLNCVSNKDDFVFDEDLPNRLIEDYFGGAKYIQKRELFVAFSEKLWGKDNDEDAVKFGNLYFIHAFLLSAVDTVVISRLHFDLVESGRYSDYPWGSVAFEELAKSLNRKLKPKGKFYMLHGMPLAIQIWLYECCSTVPRNVASRVDNQIPRLLNWKTNAPRPRYESLMESMFNEADVKVSFKNIEPTRKEISCFRIPKKVGPAGVSHKEAEVNSDDDFQDPPHPKNYSITQKKHHGDSSSSPVKKKLKQQHKGLDEQTPKSTPPPRAAKKLSVRTPIFMPIQQKEKVASNKKDLNRSSSKKSNRIQSPDSSFCSSGDEDDFVSKKVFHKFRNEKKDKDNEVDNPPMDEAVETTPYYEFSSNFVHDLYKNSKDTLVTEEINGNQSASLMEVYNEDKNDAPDKNDMDQHEARDICESPNTKLVDDNICEAHISDSQFSFPDEKTGVAVETTVNTSAEDESKDNEGAAEKILNPVESNMDNSKLNQQNQSPVHIHVALTEQRKDEQNFLDSQVTIPDELLPSLNHIDVCFYYLRKRFKYDSNTSYKYSIIDCNFMNIINSVLTVYRIDDDSLNVGGKEYHLNEYINGFRMHAKVPWHTIDHIFIPINVKAKHHWVLAVIFFNDRCIYVYDSLSPAGHDAGVLAEVEKLAEVIPICLVAYKFYEKKGIDIATHPNYKSYDKMDLFDVYVVEDLPQQPSGSFVSPLEIFFSPVDFDPDLIRTRYASILCNYGLKKEEENAQSDDEAPMRPPREISLTEDTEVHEI
ncbi:hypothetical protein T459_33122 [Capsicum annuum]|uniref:Ubiquitin-like protease family profile domain-containing protein n=1 Tax=Capsicum annuum TaxID=4072 RepID=A0A2G2XZV6_CAPAN|nr:hypothetical protein T459_33122 [Capsicum annuum]